MTIAVFQLGWMAGVLDLKGSVVLKKNKSRATPQRVLYVESKQFSVVDRLSRMTGTKPEFQEAKEKEEWMRRGCAEHCPDQHVHVQHHQFPQRMPEIKRWTATGVSMAIILHNVLPYMSDGKALEFKEHMDNVFADIVYEGQGRGAIQAAIQRLANLGWDIPNLVYEGPQQRELTA